MVEISRSEYAALYGPTTGDQVRLGDTDLWIEVEDDLTAGVPKLFFGYAMGTNLFFPFSVGASCVLFADKCTPEAIVRRIERFRPSVLVTVPTMVQQMLNEPAVASADLSSLRLATSAGNSDPVPYITGAPGRADSAISTG